MIFLMIFNSSLNKTGLEHRCFNRSLFLNCFPLEYRWHCNRLLSFFIEFSVRVEFCFKNFESFVFLNILLVLHTIPRIMIKPFK